MMAFRVEISGWRRGLRKVALTQEIQASAGLGLTDAKQLTDRILNGEVVIIDQPSHEAAEQFVDRLSTLGAVAVVHEPSSAPHAARIHWSPELQELGLPQAMRGIDPAWPVDSLPTVEEGWSLAYEFDRAPAEQGNPSLARVHFVMPAAPHHELRVGSRLLLFERATSRYATVELLS